METQDNWDHSTHDSFYRYYAEESVSPAAVERFRKVRDVILALRTRLSAPGVLDVADIGCGAGTSARIWASAGHRVTGIDVNEKLVTLARERAANERLAIRFDVGSATSLPWVDRSFDVCLLPELLEHVREWEVCLREAARVLR